jgi:hypothetical protein
VRPRRVARVAGLAVRASGHVFNGDGGWLQRKETARTVAWIDREH